jgi:hypothetical protein
MAQENLVAVNEIADRIGMDRTAARRWLKQQGFEFVAARNTGSHQRVNALPGSKAQEAINLRRRQGFPVHSDGAAGLREVTPIG